MSSHLRHSTSSAVEKTSYTQKRTVSSPPLKKQKMSLTQTYYLAHTARGKLSKEASRADHDLRYLVGHANLLDSLMLDLADAEREQESWFNQSVTGASEEPKHIQWADSIREEDAEDEWDAEISDSDDSENEEDEDVKVAAPVSLRRLPSPSATATVTSTEVDSDSDSEEEEDDEDFSELALTRTPSHTSSRALPELYLESDSESDDDSMPPSPPAQIPLDAFSEKQRQAIATTSFYSHQSSSPAALTEPEQSSFFDEGFYLPQIRETAMVSAY